jgi:hypothetical protein
MSYAGWKKMGNSKGTLHYVKKNVIENRPFMNYQKVKMKFKRRLSPEFFDPIIEADTKNPSVLQTNISPGCSHDVLLRQLQFLPTAWIVETSGCLWKDAQVDAHARAGNHRPELEHEGTSDFFLS